MSTLFFTSDTHFGHEKVIQYSSRSFDSVGQMNESLIDNWNSTVGVNDWVYHLGDVSFRRAPIDYLRRLNGNIVVLLGNHDSERQLQRCVDEGVIHSWRDTVYKRWGGHRFFLSHYAHRTWRNSHHGSYHLFGHSHGDLSMYGRSMDVGVDAVAKMGQGYRPVHVDWVVRTLEKNGSTNHHVERTLE